MLCADTLKTPGGGSGRPLSDVDKELMRAVAAAAADAMDAAAVARSAGVATVEAEQAALDEAMVGRCRLTISYPTRNRLQLSA
jgi:hypothetical protein